MASEAVKPATNANNGAVKQAFVPQSKADAPPNREFLFKNRYAVNIRLESASNLVAADLGGSSDPYCHITCGEATYVSSVVKKSLNPVWKEQIGFMFEEMPQQLHIRVLDKDVASKDDVLGETDVSLARLWLDPPGQMEADYQLAKTKHGSVHLHIECKVVPEVVGRMSSDTTASQMEDLESLLEVTVVGAKDLKNRDAIGKNDPFAVVTFGLTTFKTATICGTNEPIWSQRCPLWVTNGTKTHVLKISVYDQDLARKDLIGSTYVPLEQLRIDTEYDLWLPLTPEESKSDAQLSKLVQKIKLTPDNKAVVTLEAASASISDAANGASSGLVHIKFLRKARDDVASDFFDSLIRVYDIDGNGCIEEPELIHMLTTLGSPLNDDQIHNLFLRADLNKDGSMSRDELLHLFKTGTLQHAALLKRLITLMGKGSGSADNLLLEGVVDPIDVDSKDLKVDNEGTVVLIQDRTTGLVVKEHIPAYIKSTLRLLYRTMAGRKAAQRIRNMVAALTKKQGIKMNNPSSAANILAFVNTHNLNVHEVEKPLAEYKTFNEFFYRKLKPGARMCDAPDNASVAVSPADCRLMAFTSIDQAKKLWIKGQGFTVAQLLDGFDPSGKWAARFNGASLVIARLAPQDYHRWHFPVDGIAGKRFAIDGGYNTVNPIAVRMNVDVYTENKRVICPIETKEFGSVILVAVGATMVGSINFEDNTDEGAVIKKFQSHGFFAFGGSTVLLLFEPGRVMLDSDILANSRRKLETLIKVGQRIGVAVTGSS